MKKVFKVEDVDDGLHHTWITPLDGSKCTNSFYVKVIEFILKNEKIENLNLAHK